jgi:hypothetical protein
MLLCVDMSIEAGFDLAAQFEPAGLEVHHAEQVAERPVIDFEKLVTENRLDFLRGKDFTGHQGVTLTFEQLGKRCPEAILSLAAMAMGFEKPEENEAFLTGYLERYSKLQKDVFAGPGTKEVETEVLAKKKLTRPVLLPPII